VKPPKKYVEQQVSWCSYMLKLGISWVDNFQYLRRFRVSTTYKANLLRVTSGFPVSQLISQLTPAQDHMHPNTDWYVHTCIITTSYDVQNFIPGARKSCKWTDPALCLSCLTCTLSITINCLLFHESQKIFQSVRELILLHARRLSKHPQPADNVPLRHLPATLAESSKS
jgi:hypothetical protein